MTGNPFNTIESALEFFGLLDAAIAESLVDIRKDLVDSQPNGRRADAVRLALYKLEKLEYHVHRSRRMANDLRMLERLVFGERSKNGSGANSSDWAALA